MPLASATLDEVLNHIVNHIQTKVPTNLTTGIEELDKLMDGGWERQQLTYLVGNSGVGKSWLALWFALHAARTLALNPEARPASAYTISGNADQHIQEAVKQKASKTPLVVYWSLEMSPYQIITRLLAQAAWAFHQTDIDSRHIRHATEETWDKLIPVIEDARQTWSKNLYLEFRDRWVDEFKQTLSDLSIDHDVVLILVDYFRLVEQSDGEGIAQSQEVRSTQLMELSRLFDCAVVCLFDVNRLGQTSNRIKIEHMRGGVAAQYDSDKVLVINHHNPEKVTSKDEEYLLDLTLSKNRMGLQGEIMVELVLHNGAANPAGKGK